MQCQAVVTRQSRFTPHQTWSTLKWLLNKLERPSSWFLMMRRNELEQGQDHEKVWRHAVCMNVKISWCAAQQGPVSSAGPGQCWEQWTLVLDSSSHFIMSQHRQVYIVWRQSAPINAYVCHARSYIGWQKLNPLSQPNETLVPYKQGQVVRFWTTCWVACLTSLLQI